MVTRDETGIGGHSRRRRTAVAFLATGAVIAAVALVALVWGGGAATAQPTTTTSTTSATTTSSEPTTVTTTAPTTTPTSTPESTTTRPRRTTTTTSPTTTTTVPATQPTSSTTPWGWIALAVVLALALLLLILLLVRHRGRSRALGAWRRETAPALDAARLSRSLLQGPVADVRGEHWQDIRNRTEQAARSLERSSAHAPTDEGKLGARRAAEALRELVFAVEANVLLRSETAPPSGQQLTEADAAIRDRSADLDASLASLDRMVHPNGSNTAAAG